MDHATATGVECLLPTLLVLILAILSKRTIEPLVAGVILGLLILQPAELLGNLTDVVLTVMADDTIGWVIMVCGLMGSLIAVLVRIGGAVAFGRLAARRITSRKGALISTWLLGLAIFIDDYLNSLTISSSMKVVTDKFRVSREMLAYVVDSTAAPICVIVPLSTWSVYFSALLEDSMALDAGEGLRIYIQAIPYMFYAWIAVLIVPLVALGRIPLLGAMRGAESKVAEASDPAPPDPAPVPDGSRVANRGDGRKVVLNFFIPLMTLLFFTWFLDIDIFKGVIVALAVTLVLVFYQRLLKPGELFDTMMDGFKSMLLPLGTVVAGFMLKEVNDQLGLTPYVIGLVEPIMTPMLLPLVTFLTMALIAFATGSFWGIFAVAMPIVLPLASSMNASTPLVVGALISASAFGSHTCFYGDSTVLSAHGSGCRVMDHALTQLPYALLAAACAAFVFVLVAAS